MAKKKVIVAELSVIEFLESKFNSFNIKRYKFEELENVRNIESKNFGNVQIATLKENKVSVMLKPIPTDDIHESVNEIKLMWEAGTHKSILKFYGITKDQTKDDYFLVLEYVECNTFSDHLQDLYDYLDWNIKAGLALEIAKGLKFLHENNIAHKNLTAESILYPNNTIKLANFGILKNNVPQKRALKEKFTFWKKDKEQDHPKEYDILSFGIILFQLTQHVDYYINSNWETYLKSIPLEHREIKMDNIPIDYKKQYKELCKSCWSKNIKERPSIHQIVNSLQELGGNDKNDFVYNASQPGSETINDTSIKTTSTPSKPLTSSTTSTPSIPSTSSTQPTSYTAPHKPVTSSQLYTSPNIPTIPNIPTTNTTTTTYTNSRSSPYTSTTRTNTTNTPPTTTIPTNPLVPPTNPFLNNSGTANSAISPLTIDFILSPQQITSLILGLTTPPPQNTAPVTQEYVTKMYKTFHDKVAKCEMDISKLNDLYIIQYLNKTVQNENKVFDFCNANQSLMINKVLLGLFHQLAIGTTTVSLPKAYELYKEASKKNSFAAYIAGTYAQYGQGVPKNATEAYNFYKSSAESGFVPAYNKIGLCYDMGTGVAVDKQKAFYWIEKSAKADDKYGQYNLGAYYETGNGCAKDESKGFTWYLKAGDQGFVTALNKVGLCYLQGKGTTVDYYRSYEWFKKAAIAGCKYGQTNLGSAYELGRGIEKNEVEAFNWFLKAANNENYDLGQYYLARCYEFGIGTTIDRLKALEWYQKSADNGNSLALLALADIRSTIQAQPLLYYLY
ncbi:HCP-like protein [Rhizophagus irregularis]|uniref:Kinase-like domain-containing protein n=3 Tax=Rhizophagus irregularis TaxID=588596 RepID=U9SXX4_RHIID|nr:kinase-like domain-containing protein [Rhizophagus irregularis DAOM 181602=DAOM 197198]EXX54984.1 Skt5p [Rhizophagus irregularis DAOM 197198w]PKC15841.1 HCP-like protein [Rhizophagus irregularis]PKC73048.1 HCP-like protein [Rhizophagus irregularis]PKY16321.1 HCP-like protein [Rhizophagus irregularis]POG79557.1 kinase-like domain-containing protein [Rhizophagus irregularis DAOM 181602=DAOM 197198]|eukprot:XP_025186423.1 kinase-like domain-containing protein [Rhizophagus irregularis DAOM 181602=DAOM 197198]